MACIRFILSASHGCLRSGGRRLLWVVQAAACLVALTSPARAQEDLATSEERAIQAAVEAVAPSVVRIETLGGLERVGNVLIGVGPATGLVVAADGYIVSSAFNFAQKPAQVLVTLPDGTRLPAKQVSTDHSRQLVLLKIDPPKPLPVPEAAPVKDLAVGQWTIALGRTFDSDRPNLSVGILSAVGRIWSKAIQTDAKISPGNYGGPLIDIRGRVIGVLAPLSQDGGGEIAGVEWYDSGIGFAVPLEHINGILDRMKSQPELHGGLLGISLKGTDLYAQEAIIAACPGGSPAQLAGLKPGDKIVEIDGMKITRQAELKHQLSPRYAGDKVKVVALRKDERIEREVTLVAKLVPYQHPFLGVLPMRPVTKKAADNPRTTPGATEGVAVRYLYPDSPAAAALKPGDVILSIDGKPVAEIAAALEITANLTIGQPAIVQIRRGDEALSVSLKPTKLPESVPSELPVARTGTAAAKDAAAADEDKPVVGPIEIKVPESANGCLAFVPESYRSDVPHGIVLWLHPAGGVRDDELIAAWKAHCAKFDLILLAPKSGDASRWQRTELEFIRKTVDELITKYNIDRRRIAVVGQEGGGAMAYLFAFANRDLSPGIVAIDAPLPNGASIPANDPMLRQAYYLTHAKKSAASKAIEATVKQLRSAKYPVTEKNWDDAARPLTDEERAELARWVDSLDRF